MHTKLKFIGAALFALLLTVTPALAFTSHALPTQHHSGLFGVMALLTMGVAGVTITYTATLNAPRNATGGPFASGGSTVAPTAAQAAQMNSLAVTLVLADGDTTATVIHNWNLSAAEATALEPWLSWYWSTAGTGALAFAIGTTNVVVTKAATGTGAGGTLNIILERPNSFIQ